MSLKDLEAVLTCEEQEKWLNLEETSSKITYKRGITESEKRSLQELAFSRLDYDKKLEYCYRPEQVKNLPQNTWSEINSYYGTNASNFQEFVKEVGGVRFGHTPKIGDAFCGGGSIPFEAARLGCDTFGSDLNPVASLLTWSALNLVGGGSQTAQRVRQIQRRLYEVVDKQITEWGIEHKANSWRADAYIYCLEATCPECGWLVPLSPSWLIAPYHRVIAKLQPDESRKQFDIKIVTGATLDEVKAADEKGTIKGIFLLCPNSECQKSSPIDMLRKKTFSEDKARQGLRLWENRDVVPRADDVFRERLYCIRWTEIVINQNGAKSRVLYYCEPDEKDLTQEEKVLSLLSERFDTWQEKGYIPSRPIQDGEKTNEPIRTRGWTYWHHLFNPRQLLLCGLFNELSEQYDHKEASLLLVGKIANSNSRLSRWKPSQGDGIGNVVEVYSNQALNTLYNYGCRGLLQHQSIIIDFPQEEVTGNYSVITSDCRAVTEQVDIWITDPPYADAISYHELSEFFLAWYEKKLPRLFPDWYTDSKRALAVSGPAEVFRLSMVECYRNLARHMPDNGMQVVMFTHQDAAVWADLALILWASGLSVTAAWCIVTETNSALKEGNYVQGTVLLILRKQTSDEVAFLDEIHPQIETEVKEQLKSMLALEDNEDPNFTDTDYQLAAYASALRVLTRYRQIEDIDVTYELNKERRKGETSPVEALIDEAVRVAAEYLLPKSFDPYIWKRLRPEERFYLRGLDIAKNGEHRTGAYQELARGFGLKEYKYMLGNNKANEAALKTATGFGTRNFDETSFGDSPTRHVLFAIHEAVRTDDAQVGKNWLRAEVKDYWTQRRILIEISRYLSALSYTLPDWKKDAEAARLLTGALENDHL